MTTCSIDAFYSTDLATGLCARCPQPLPSAIPVIRSSAYGAFGAALRHPARAEKADQGDTRPRLWSKGSVRRVYGDLVYDGDDTYENDGAPLN